MVRFQNKGKRSSTSKQRIISVLFAVVLSLTSTAYASTSSTTTPSAKKSPWSFTGIATYGSSLRDRERVDYTQEATLRAIPGYKVTEGTKVGVDIIASKQLEGERREKLASGFAYWNQDYLEFGSNNQFAIKSVTRAYSNIDPDRRRDTTYNGGLYFRPMFIVDGAKLGYEMVKFTFRPQYLQNFHDFEAFNGTVNTESSLGIIGQLDLTFSDEYGFGALFGTRDSWTYGGARAQSYLIDASISYQPSKQYLFLFGYAIDQSTTDALGADNVKFFDEETSEVYVSLYFLN